MIDFVCSLLLMLIQACFRVVHFLRHELYLLHLQHIFHPWKSKLTASQMKSSVDGLNKVPSHIAFNIMENDISYKKLAQILVWCNGFGIKLVTVFDFAGELKRNVAKLHKEVTVVQQTLELSDPSFREFFSTINVKVPHSPSTCDSRKEINMNNSAHHQNGHCTKDGVSMNGASSGRRIGEVWPPGGVMEVSVCSKEDGRQALVDICRHMSRTSPTSDCDTPAAPTALQSPPQITPKLVDSLMDSMYELSEPNLVVRFGRAHCMMGFLPWQLRLAEILHFPSLQHITYKDFYSMLRRYGSCQQRFGK